MTSKKFLAIIFFQGLCYYSSPALAADLQLQANEIIENRCVVCHACYDAPCQLKLSSQEGLYRGASKLTVYDFSRLRQMQPTRLFIDARNAEQWQQKEFSPVLDYDNLRDNWYCDNCLLSSLLLQKNDRPLSISQPLPDDFPLDITRTLSCAQPDEVNHFFDEQPLAGMPYGMAALPTEEYDTLQRWLASESITLGKEPKLIDEQSHGLIEQWELFLNQETLENQLLARYLYEHWFIAHIRFTDDDPFLFRIVRSRNLSTDEIDEIPTLRPTDDPEQEFTYRFKILEEDLVDKTHIPLNLGARKLAEIQQLFFEQAWSIEQLPAYGNQVTANPFEIYSAIPVKARYQFLLNDAHFFIESFIKGPVCRGQVALNVINDHFFVAFLDPEYDLSVVDPEYLNEAASLLQLPEAISSLTDFDNEWLEKLQHHRHYLTHRNDFYSNSTLTRSGLALDAIWKGVGEERPGGLTVFRHFDSATVLPGFVGQTPDSTWVIDYPILERIYYGLVANYDVFSSASHQILTRIYMDYLRMEAESLFVSLLPLEDREPTLESWYQGAVAQAKLFWVHSDSTLSLPSKINFNEENSYTELINILRSYLSMPDSLIPSDPDLFKLNTLSASTSPWIEQIPDLVYLLLTDNSEEITEVFTLLRNKSHSNVSFIFGESSRRAPERDTVTIVNGSIGSYPNFIFVIPETEQSDFITELTSIENQQDLRTLVESYGVRRTDPRIWPTLDKLHQFRNENENKPQFLDMNRYNNL